MKSDLQIRRDVIEALEWEPAVDAQQVGVDVRHGIVTLSGRVGSDEEQRRAESAARRVHGVEGLALAIELQWPGPDKRTDAAVARAVTDLLSWTIDMPAGPVQVVVERGWVTLTGRVEWNYPRRLAMNAVRSLGGVVGVSDDTITRPSAALSAINDVIEAARRHRPDARFSAITEDVHGSEPTLAGAVRSWVERDRVGAPAWAMPRGRRAVDDTAVH